MSKDHKALGLTRDDLIKMYRTMYLIREFEENAVAYFKQGIVIGNMHMYVGEEATATGICYALTNEDYVASTHRCDGHLIAKGADTKAMMAELMGRENGICGGRAGKMHQSAPEVGFMVANGVVGASISQATGHALYCQMYAPGRVAVSFFGDGGGNQGAFLECVNMASVWKLPAIYVCENNHYAISTSVESSTALGHFWQRAEGLGIPGVLVNGNDVLEVYAAAKEAVARARAGEGPTLIECDTYRFRGHHEGDEQTYRSKEEVQEMKEHNNCLTTMKNYMAENVGWTEEEDAALVKSVQDQVAESIAFGLAGKPMSAEGMETKLFA